jgi:hypothetical protein
VFNNSSLPFVFGATPGEQVTVYCSGMPDSHPYLFMETSLLLGIDPKAAPLLDGQITSVPGLLALLDSLPEINPLALTFPTSNSSGDLSFTYTLPTTRAVDPNAVCPPTTTQINDGLIGCGLAMIDLTTFKTVAAGSAVVEYQGDPEFPPNPTLALSTAKAAPGQTVTVSDAPGATTRWWLATLSALGALLGGSAPVPVVYVRLSEGGSLVGAKDAITLTPAVYNNPVLTPPAISGTFTVPNAPKGKWTVTVTDHTIVDGFHLANVASAPLKIT